MNYYSLNQNEIDLVTMIGTRRWENGRAVKFNHQLNVGAGMTVDQDIEAVAGELACAAVLDVYYDIKTDYPTADLLPIQDLTYKGKTIDVKTTTWKNGVLFARGNKLEKQCDLYVLVVREPKTWNFTVAGYATNEMLFKKENYKDLGGYGKPVYQLPQCFLHTLGELLEL